MKILFIAPLPPPTHGQSLASKVFYRRLRKDHDVEVVNMAKRSARHLVGKLCRFPTVGRFLIAVARKKRNADLIYLTISESALGNLKDLCIYAICHRDLDRMVVHMLGGAGMQRILEPRGLRYRLNRLFISQMKGVVVEGRVQAATFSLVTTTDKTHVVPNFAQDYLFASEEEVRLKFANMERVHILFLSNLLYGKGHRELVDGYLNLSDDLRKRITIDFVGGFGSGRDEREFLDSIRGHDGLVYRGAFIGGDRKRLLYLNTHVFCLPTYYPYEGQPISILEAYATGCVVVTTEHSGIPDVFADGINGFKVEKQSAASITAVLERIVQVPEALLRIGLVNLGIAREQYKTSTYQRSMMRIVETALHDGASSER